MAQFVQKTIRKSGREYYETHLHLINPLLEHSLTPTEIVVLSAFMSDVSEIATIDRFHREVRKKVKRDLEISNGGLSNYLRAFKDKEIVQEGSNGLLYIKEFLYPEKDQQFYQYKLIYSSESTKE